MYSFRLLTLTLLVLSGSTFLALSESEDYYAHVTIADLAESYEKVKLLPIKKFQFLHDSIPGRVQIGVLGQDAQRHIPEAVDVIETLSFPAKEKGKEPTVLKNFLSVDKTVVFMHGVAALKELTSKYDMLESSFVGVKNLQDHNQADFIELQSKLSVEVELQATEKERMLKIEEDAVDREEELELLKIEEERKFIDKKLSNEKMLLEFQAEVAREKMRREEEFAILEMQERIKMEKDLAEKKEQIRREASEKIQKQKQELEEDFNQKRLEYEKEKIRAEVELKAQQERENEDLNIRKLKVQAELESEQIISTITVLFDEVGKMMYGIISQPQKLVFIFGLTLVFVLSFYGIKEFVGLVRSTIQSYIGKPSLVRETSMHWHFLPAFIADYFSTEDYKRSLLEIEKHLQGVVLGREDRERVVQLALTTRNTKNTKAPYRHVLLHGPPGTGKTLIARKLAECSGMDYAIMSGGDVGPLGEDAVSQLHKLFQWAHKSRKGLLLFIDEAEAFLSSRSGQTSDDNASVRHALNALLYQTGTPSRSFMLILATNRPQELDSAILDRIDVSLQIDLPGLEQRQELVKLYMKIHVISSIEKQVKNSWFDFRKSEQYSVDEECLSLSVLQSIAKDTEGFSGREISKLFIAVRYALSITPEKTLKVSAMNFVVSEKVFEHNQKTGFVKLEDIGGSPRSPRGTRPTDAGSPFPRFSENYSNNLQAKLAQRPESVVMSTGKNGEES